MMMNQAFQKQGEPASAGRGRLRAVLCSLVCLLVMAAVLVCAAPARAAEAGEGIASAAQTAPCKGLKPYKNLDELLYQFYINLDSDCLFKMSVAELEKIWETKILNEREVQFDKYWSAKRSIAFGGKPYISEKDAFYVEISPHGGDTKSVFTINITQEYKDKYHSLLPIGQFPKLLPKPVSKVSSAMPQFDWRAESKRKAEGRPGFSPFHFYWYSADGKRTIRLSWDYGLTTVWISQ